MTHIGRARWLGITVCLFASVLALGLTLGAGRLAIGLVSVWCIVDLLRTAGRCDSLPRHCGTRWSRLPFILVFVTVPMPVAVEGDGDKALVGFGWPLRWLVQVQQTMLPALRRSRSPPRFTDRGVECTGNGHRVGHVDACRSAAKPMTFCQSSFHITASVSR